MGSENREERACNRERKEWKGVGEGGMLMCLGILLY